MANRKFALGRPVRHDRRPRARATKTGRHVQPAMPAMPFTSLFFLYFAKSLMRVKFQLLGQSMCLLTTQARSQRNEELRQQFPLGV